MLIKRAHLGLHGDRSRRRASEAEAGKASAGVDRGVRLWYYDRLVDEGGLGEGAGSQVGYYLIPLLGPFGCLLTLYRRLRDTFVVQRGGFMGLKRRRVHGVGAARRVGGSARGSSEMSDGIVGESKLGI